MIIDGYKYWLQYTKGRNNYYRCSRFKHSQPCPGRCVRRQEPPQAQRGDDVAAGGSGSGSGGGPLVTRHTHAHNHGPELADSRMVDAFRRALTQRAADEPHVPLHTIYWDEASQRHLDASMQYRFVCAESAMRKARLRRQQRARQQQQLPVAEPRTVAEVDAWLAAGGARQTLRVRGGGGGGGKAQGSGAGEYSGRGCGDDNAPGNATFYRTTLKLAGDVSCWLFAHGGTMRRLERIEQLHVDAAALDDALVGCGLMVFHAVQASGSTPIIYAITSPPVTIGTHNTAPTGGGASAHSTSLYAAVFAYVREHFGQHIRPTMLVTNYADALQQAAAYTYPDATVKGFWHEYTGAVLQRIRADDRLLRETAADSGGNGHGSSWLRMLLVLPLLPADYMQPGLEAVRRWAADKRLLTPAAQQLCSYVADQWLRPMGAGKISMFGVPNAVHRHAQQFALELRDMVPVPTAGGGVDVGGAATATAAAAVEGEVSVFRLMKIVTQLATRAWSALQRRDRVTAMTAATAAFAAAMPTAGRGKKPLAGNLQSGNKRCERHRDAVITDATEQWIRTPVHLRNPLQFLQLSSHCANDLLFAGAGVLPQASPTGPTAASTTVAATAPASAPPQPVATVMSTTLPTLVAVVPQQQALGYQHHQQPSPQQTHHHQHQQQHQQHHHHHHSHHHNQQQLPHQQQQQHHHHQPLLLVADVPAAISFDQLLQNDHNYFFDTTPLIAPASSTSTSASCAQASVDASTLFHPHESFQIIPPDVEQHQQQQQQSMFDALHLQQHQQQQQQHHNHHHLYGDSASAASSFVSYEQHATIMTTPTPVALMQTTTPQPPPLLIPTAATPSVVHLTSSTGSSSNQRPAGLSSDPPPLMFYRKPAGDARKALTAVTTAIVRRSEPPPLVPLTGSGGSGGGSGGVRRTQLSANKLG